MRKAYKYRLYPTRNQTEALEGQVIQAQRLYNAALEQRRFAYKQRDISLNYYDQAKDLKSLRESGECRLANFSACQDVLRRVDKTFQAFFNRLKRGDKPGYPRFKSRHRYDSYTFPSYGDGCRIRGSGKLYLQGVGELKVKWHRDIEGRVKTVTVRRQAGKWYVCFSVEVDAEPLPELNTEVGIDMGLTHFATLSTGETIDNPRYFKAAQAGLRRAQRKVARRKKGSHRRRKAVLELQRAHEHVKNQRRDFHHKVARKLVDAYQFIAAEALNVKGLSRGMLSKSVGDVAWGGFFEILSAKAEEAARQFVQSNPAGTSQYCLCGVEVRKTLAVRIHHCHDCGLVKPRDEVSAILILRLGRSLKALT